jgi:hypothetical protein
MIETLEQFGMQKRQFDGVANALPLPAALRYQTRDRLHPSERAVNPFGGAVTSTATLIWIEPDLDARL